MRRRSALIVLADGARADIFERLLAEGRLPNIQRHVIDRGGYRRASSTFTSTTGPAHLPFLTGCFPGTVNVPGYRWFDRAAYRPGLPAGPWCMRSYNGPEAFLYAKDMKPGIDTIYGLTDEAINVFGVVTKGVKDGNDLFARVKNPVWLWAHYAHDYTSADRLAARATTAALERDSEVRFVVFPGIDWQSHYVDAEGPGAMRSYAIVDKAIGDAAKQLQRQGAYDDTLIVICSDHGHSPVEEHYDLPVRLETDHDLRTAYHSWPAFRRHPDAVACVSGNGMCQVYIKAQGWRHEPTRDQIADLHPGLIEGLMAEPAVDLLITRADDGWLIVESRRGRARVRETDAGVDYVVETTDPFGWPALPTAMTSREALETHLRHEPPGRARADRAAVPLAAGGRHRDQRDPRLRLPRALRAPGAPLGARFARPGAHDDPARDQRTRPGRPAADGRRLRQRARLSGPADPRWDRWRSAFGALAA